MVQYREIIRMASLGISKRSIAESLPCSRNTASKVVERAKELGLTWPLPPTMTDGELEKILFPHVQESDVSDRCMPDYEYIRKELQRNGVTKKLLWNEYLEKCRMTGDKPLMYSQFCYYIQQDEMKRRATMHIARKPGEQVEVDWAGDKMDLIDPDTGEITPAHIFVGVMSFSQYAYIEAFVNERQPAWITGHIHMFEFFGGIPRILVPDNCKTAVNHDGDWYTPELNSVYHDMAEHYGIAIVPARVRKPKDKPNAEGSVRNVGTGIMAPLRNEQFFSLGELNAALWKRLKEYNARKFQKKDGSRDALFHEEEFPLLSQLPAYPYEMAVIKQATVQFNYHISFDSMFYSVPHEFIGRKVDVRATEKTVEVFFNHNRIASHVRLRGRKGQYSTEKAHMPADHQKYLEWNGDRFRKWASQIGESTERVVDALLTSQRVEQQAYRSCMGLLKLAEKYSPQRLEGACAKALTYTSTPSFKSVKNLIVAEKDTPLEKDTEQKNTQNQYGITRGAEYYGR